MKSIRMPWAHVPSHLAQEPYFYGWIDDMLPLPLYDQLADSFVEPETHPALNVLGKGKKRVSFMIPPVTDSFGDVGGAWRNLLDYLSDLETRAAALDWVRRSLPLDALPEGPYRELFALRHALTPDQLCWYCEYSSLDPSVLLPPHSDSTDKLLIFVLYFAPHGWQAEWDGGTEVYTAADPAQNHNFSNFFLPHERVARVDRCDYRANRAFFFVKNHAAWHGVSPVNPAATAPRRSFNFSLRIRPDADLPPRMVELMADIRAQEARAFPQ